MLKNFLKNLLWSRGYDISKVDTSFNIKHIYKNLTNTSHKFELKNFGPDNMDGSYQIPMKLLTNISNVISFGVGPNYDFEKQLAAKGLKVDMYDESVDIDNPDNGINFIKKFVKPIKSSTSIGINDLFYDLELKYPESKLLLKMDIEGDEYANILTLNEKFFDNICILIIEFHYLNRLADKNTNRERYYALEKILKYFNPIYNKPNMISSSYQIQDIQIPKYLEVTLVNKSINYDN